jgi:hypothetical protein
MGKRRVKLGGRWEPIQLADVKPSALRIRLAWSDCGKFDNNPLSDCTYNAMA